MWSKKHSCCIKCGTKEIGHMAKGLCKRCYSSCYASNPKNSDRVKLQKHNWYLKQGGAKYSKKCREKQHFNGLREAALKRDNYKCVQCGCSKDLVVHYKNGKG